MVEPQVLYAEALELGEQLLVLLHQAPPDIDFEHVEALLERREHVAVATERLAAGGIDLSACLPQLKELVAQQERLESVVGAAMADLRQKRGVQLRQGQSVQALNRLLNTRASSSQLNQRL